MTTIPSVSLPLFALLLAGAGAAQSNSVGPYDAESFEAPRLQPGTLPGTGYADGQDGWMLLDSAHCWGCGCAWCGASSSASRGAWWASCSFS